MLVKSIDEGSHLDDLRETFKTRRRYKMKLNLSKCAFGVSLGKFLGFMVSQRGIEVNPDKIQAILDMEPPKNIKEVQSLTGRVAALNRFFRKPQTGVYLSSMSSGRHSNGRTSVERLSKT